MAGLVLITVLICSLLLSISSLVGVTGLEVTPTMEHNHHKENSPRSPGKNVTRHQVHVLFVAQSAAYLEPFSPLARGSRTLVEGLRVLKSGLGFAWGICQKSFMPFA
jgi:hypothetical protein